MNFGNSDHLAHRISIFEKLRAQATSSQFQTPSSKEAPSSKLKNRPARRLPRHLFGGFGVLRFATSLGLGVWCLVFRSAVAQKLRCALAALGWSTVGARARLVWRKSGTPHYSQTPMPRGRIS